MKKQINRTRFFIMLILLFAMTGILLYGLNHIGMFHKNDYENEISASAHLFGVDPILVEALMKRESNLNPNVVSSKGAVGLMQLMPKTAQEISEQLVLPEYDTANLKDPSTNIMFGTYYLAKLLNYYNNNLILTLAAYNAGIGNVDKWLAQDPKIAVKISKIPFKETKRHVRAIIITYNFYKGAYQLKRLLKIKKKD